MDQKAMKLELKSLERDFNEPLADVKRVVKALDTLGPHERKFIVLAGKKKLYIIIGMVFVDDRKHADFYMHRQMVDVSKDILDRNGTGAYELKGGGVLELRRSFGKDKAWEATFGGASSDFGVWDHRVLGHRQVIADALDMHVSFRWHGYAYPASMMPRRGL